MSSPKQQQQQQQQQQNLQSLVLPFKTRIALKFLNLITDAVRRTNGTVNRRVFNLLDRRVPANPTPYNSVSTHDITVNPETNLWFRLFVPTTDNNQQQQQQQREPAPVIVFFHGGGFAFLSAASYAYDAVCRRFARKMGAVVCSVEYRLAPEHKFPSQYDDGVAVLEFLDKRRAEIDVWPENADVSKCFVAGDSAGGNISHNVTVRACNMAFSDLKVIGLINIQPFFGGKDQVDSEVDLEGAPIVSLTRTTWMWNALLPPGVDTDHWAVNVSGPNAVDLKGLDFPATLLFIGGFDPLKDWQRRYYEWLRKSGKDVKLVEYSDAIHAFYVFPELPQANLLFTEVKDFIHKRLSKL